MPHYKETLSLEDISCKEVSCLLLHGCQTLDRRWEEPVGPPCSSPPTSPVKTSLQSPCREEIVLNLPVDQKEVLDWLVHLPDLVVEKVVTSMLAIVEARLLEDKDRKLIMTLINIEKMRVNDFFFGVHSLLSIVQGCRLQKLQFSKRLWCCLWEYGEITGTKKLSDTLCLSLPGLTNLTSLTVAHVANDRIVYTISRYLTKLTMLDLSSSRITDRSLRFLSGQNIHSVAGRGITVISDTSNRAVVHNFSSIVNTGWIDSLVNQAPGMVDQESRRERSGCHLLERLNLQACDGVTEAGVRHLLDTLENLHSIDYHQIFSVLEVLIKWTGSMTQTKREQKRLSLTEVEHGFPYSLSPLPQEVNYLANICPRLTTLTLVTKDTSVALLASFTNMISLTVELEDCLGEGFLTLLEKTSLRHLSVSCSSDPDATLEGGQEAQQGQLFNLASIAVGLLVPGLAILSVSGCGLVSSAALQKMELVDILNSPSWLKRQNWFSSLTSLILMSYEDTTVTINSGLLRSILLSSSRLEVLNLEGNFGSFFTDKFVTELTYQGALTNLCVLDISVCDEGGGVPGRVPLTLKTSKTILNKCPDLKELRISDWNISDEEFQQLEQIILDNNWNITLTRRLARQV